MKSDAAESHCTERGQNRTLGRTVTGIGIAGLLVIGGGVIGAVGIRNPRAAADANAARLHAPAPA
jgi:hypothetical protein